jgi:hypothetical protein
MPEMDIRWTSVGAIWDQIFAYMGFQGDAVRRQACVAGTAARRIAGLDALFDEPNFQKTIFESTVCREAFSSARAECVQTFNEFGGFRALGSLLSPDFQKENDFPADEMRTVAEVMLTIRSIETHHRSEVGSGSVNKASFLIALGKGKGSLATLKNETQIERTWRNYKNVSHLAAAMRIIAFNHELNHEWMIYDEEDLALFIYIAIDYLNFGISFRPHGRKEFLLDLEEVWSFPKQFPLRDRNISPPLHEIDLAALRQFRAT